MLLTKLHRPPISKEHVYRDHLIDLLDKNLYKPVSLISAGAGYGKSMLISSWLEKSKIPYAWVSLSNEDNEIRDFIRCISTSVNNKFPKALVHLNDYVETAELPPMSKIDESLINGLDEIGKEFVLVLDDYHLIQNMQINKLINQLLQFPPQLMHLVIICRSDPFLNLSSLRAYSRINEIRMSELCFNESEILELLKNVFQTESSAAISHKLMQQTEGWITGLRLLLLMVKKGEDLNESLEKIHSINPINTNFLLEEVILNQPEPIRNCILKMSILDRFCDELVNELCFPHVENLEADSSGKDVIQALLNANLFTISLDYNGKWYRFHHLFREMLQNQLKKQHSIDEINAYHLKAASWFDKNGFKEAAAKQALKGHKTDLAVDYISSYRFELLEAGQMHLLNRLIDMLPESSIEESPTLLMAKASVMEYWGQIPGWVGYMEKAKALLSNISDESQELDIVRGEVATSEGELLMLSGDWKNAIKYSKKALKILPKKANHALSFAMGIQVVCCQMANDIGNINEVMVEYPVTNEFLHTRMQLWYCIAYAMEGDTNKLKISAHKLIRFAEKPKNKESIVFGKYFLSAAHYLLLENGQAEPYLKGVEAIFSMVLLILPWMVK